jgi:hypothetical protein
MPTSTTFSRKDVSTLPMQILPADTASTSRTIRNVGTVTVYLGSDMTVSVSSGFPLPPDKDLVVPSSSGICGVTASGVTTLGIITSQ